MRSAGRRAGAGIAVFLAVSLSLYAEGSWRADVLLGLTTLVLPAAVGARWGLTAAAAYLGCVAATFVHHLGVAAWAGSGNFQWQMLAWLVLTGAACAAALVRAGRRARTDPAGR